MYSMTSFIYGIYNIALLEIEIIEWLWATEEIGTGGDEESLINA